MATGPRFVCGVISYEASAHPSKHNGAVVSVLGLATTGIDPAFLSSPRVRMRGRSIPAGFDFLCGRLRLSADSLMFSMRMQERFDTRRFESDVLLNDALQKQRNLQISAFFSLKYQESASLRCPSLICSRFDSWPAGKKILVL